MFKKLFIGICIGVLALGILYLYFLVSGNPNTLRNRIQEYETYTAIFFMSIVFITMLQGSNKIFRFLIFIIVTINLFILGDTFFRNNIGLDSMQFITLFGLILLALAISYITHRIRYVFMGIVGLGIVFVLLTGILPLYNHMPNINDFIQSQKSKIVNKGVIEGTLLIKNELGTKEIAVKDISKNDINLSQKTQISFASKTKTGLEKIFIDLGNGAFININPQSAVSIQQSGNNTIMEILQGDIQYYAPPELYGTLQLIGKYKGKNIQDIQNSIRGDLYDQFQQKKEKYIIDQLGGMIIFHPTIDKIIRFSINTLYSISPKNYQQNLTNYNNIQTYLGKYMTGSVNTANTGENIKNILNDIMSQIKKGTEETTILNKLK